MNDMEISTIGERIKTLRKKRGYNQKELADLLGKSLRTIQKYESGEIAGYYFHLSSGASDRRF